GLWANHRRPGDRLFGNRHCSAGEQARMLDANRRTGIGTPLPGRFDNWSVSLPSDFPSANLLLHKGVCRALLVQERGLQPQPDLAHTLRRWQDAGMQISTKELSSAEGPAHCVVQRPHFYRAI